MFADQDIVSPGVAELVYGDSVIDDLQHNASVLAHSCQFSELSVVVELCW